MWVCRPSEVSARHTCASIIFRTCIEHYFLNGVCETRLFVLFLRAQSSCFTHGVRKSRACADQFTLAHVVCETATLRMQKKQKGEFHTLR